jgi:hypothetical protein
MLDKLLLVTMGTKCGWSGESRISGTHLNTLVK